MSDKSDTLDRLTEAMANATDHELIKHLEKHPAEKLDGTTLRHIKNILTKYVHDLRLVFVNYPDVLGEIFGEELRRCGAAIFCVEIELTARTSRRTGGSWCPRWRRTR